MTVLVVSVKHSENLAGDATFFTHRRKISNSGRETTNILHKFLEVYYRLF